MTMCATTPGPASDCLPARRAHMDSTNALNAPEIPTGTSSATAVNHSLVTASGEQCPSCGTTVAADQRYCLNCGQRCGEPRLPFMNAVTFMDAMKRPTAAAPPAKAKRPGIFPNAALIAGVGTLILAMGVGVLIGRSGDHSTATATPAAAQIIKVPAGGGEAEASTASTGKAATGGAAKGKPKKQGAAALDKEATSQKGAEEVLKPSAGVTLPPATVEQGGKCASGTAGCKGGEFTGDYFGE